jgi:hypothetical protein
MMGATIGIMWCLRVSNVCQGHYITDAADVATIAKVDRGGCTYYVSLWVCAAPPARREYLAIGRKVRRGAPGPTGERPTPLARHPCGTQGGAKGVGPRRRWAAGIGRDGASAMN